MRQEARAIERQLVQRVDGLPCQRREDCEKVEGYEHPKVEQRLLDGQAEQSQPVEPQHRQARAANEERPPAPLIVGVAGLLVVVVSPVVLVEDGKVGNAETVAKREEKAKGAKPSSKQEKAAK